MAERAGMVLRMPPVQPRSRKAFEAAEYARAKGHFDEMHEALFKAFFEDGRNINEVQRALGHGRVSRTESRRISSVRCKPSNTTPK